MITKIIKYQKNKIENLEIQKEIYSAVIFLNENNKGNPLKDCLVIRTAPMM